MSLTPVTVANLKIGMFVAELDRPWSETPFLTEGFRIVESDQLEVLRAYCKRVFVDPLKSAPESIAHLGDLRGKPHGAGWDGDHPFEIALARVFPEWRRKHLTVSMLQGTLARTRHALDQRVLSAVGRGRIARRPAQRSRALPSDIPVWSYRQVKSARTEMTRARPLYQYTERVLQAMIEDVRAGKTVDLEPINQVAKGLVQSVIANPQPLLWLSAVRALGAQSTDHAMKVAVQLLAFGRWQGFGEDRLRRLAIIGLTVDVGKARVDAKILQKREALNAEELAQVRRHVEYALDALGGKEALEEDIYRGIAEHHERLDGSGYPFGLKEGKIGLYGRMAAIADTFATLTTRRSYAPAMTALDAMRVLYSGTESGFSRQLVEDFMAALGVYPIGSLIELTSGEIAVILSHTPGHHMRPRVLVLTDPEKTPRPSRVVDLLSNPRDRDDHKLSIQRALPLGAYGLDPRRFQLG